MHKQKGTYNSIKRILLFILLVFSTASYSKELLILLSDDQKIHNEIAALIVENSSVSATIRLYTEHTKSEVSLEGLVIVAIGTRACDQAITNLALEDQLICTLIPAQTYQTLITKHNKADLNQNSLTAVFMDQPIERQIRLVKLIAPDAKSIGTVFGQTSISQRSNFERYGQALNFVTHHAFLDETQNPVQILTPLIQRSDVFLAIPDNANFNRSVSRWALYITLRNKIPLIGFSASYSEAGAVVSLYSTTEQLALQTRETLVNLLIHGNLAPASFPKEFTIMVNDSTARTLRMNLPDTEFLTEQLKEIDR
ncbi:ABC transporter substrate-binding protein [Nitrincola schmidtii]|uniref:ABC transporter substrate-binding protein n=1 Tax=Nitrincola schmidtii TaxID=1730894 RepID=UPI00124D10B3|nr:ABC transporter substrate binding protein [Nitrincola schmidtii]